MSVIRLNEIPRKLNELRAVFCLGQRAIPFLEDVFTFLEEISPLMDEINASLRESTDKMPHARSQLESVTQATELATNEIMDLIDVLQAMTQEARADAEARLHDVEALRQADVRLQALLNDHLDDPDEALQDALDAHLSERQATYEALETHLHAQVDSFKRTRDSLNQILMSLQVQDITSQQIAAVNHLIENIRTRMYELTTRLNDRLSFEDTDFALAEVEAPSTFDPNARYDHSPDRQAQADDIIASFQTSGGGPASQDEIDQLFTGGDGLSGERASQDDIDKLFGGA
ncbi:hypothetical protein AWN76_017500 [Rhodothermaceae bacterium RA]|nr:hypothetical protein AWN76_017500 [Rhodothermaceae bacterium RA]